MIPYLIQVSNSPAMPGEPGVGAGLGRWAVACLRAGKPVLETAFHGPVDLLERAGQDDSGGMELCAWVARVLLQGNAAHRLGLPWMAPDQVQAATYLEAMDMAAETSGKDVGPAVLCAVAFVRKEQESHVEWPYVLSLDELLGMGHALARRAVLDTALAGAQADTPRARM